jgi:hypothetical protein
LLRQQIFACSLPKRREQTPERKRIAPNSGLAVLGSISRQANYNRSISVLGLQQLF